MLSPHFRTSRGILLRSRSLRIVQISGHQSVVDSCNVWLRREVFQDCGAKLPTSPAQSMRLGFPTHTSATAKAQQSISAFCFFQSAVQPRAPLLCMLGWSGTRGLPVRGLARAGGGSGPHTLLRRERVVLSKQQPRIYNADLHPPVGLPVLVPCCPSRAGPDLPNPFVVIILGSISRLHQHIANGLRTPAR